MVRSLLMRAIVLQRKTGMPVQFELTVSTRAALAEWVHQARLESASYLFPG